MTEYKFVEVTSPTAEELTRVVNAETQAGWSFESMQFAMRESSRRPAMAFVLFSRRPEPS
jgi:hypothetical protein